MTEKRKKSTHPYRCLVYAPKINSKLFEQHLILTFKGLVYAIKCLKPPSLSFINKKMIELPREKPNRTFFLNLFYFTEHKKTLVLDLDETLVHTTSFIKKGCIPI